MGELREVEQLYRELGRNWKALAPWQIYVLTSHDKFDRLYGRPADKTKKLYNGMLPCYLYEFFKPADEHKKEGAPYGRDPYGKDRRPTFDRRDGGQRQWSKDRHPAEGQKNHQEKKKSYHKL